MLGVLLQLIFGVAALDLGDRWAGRSRRPTRSGAGSAPWCAPTTCSSCSCISGFLVALPLLVARYGGLDFLMSNLPATHFVWHGGNPAAVHLRLVPDRAPGPGRADVLPARLRRGGREGRAAGRLDLDRRSGCCSTSSRRPRASTRARSCRTSPIRSPRIPSSRWSSSRPWCGGSSTWASRDRDVDRGRVHVHRRRELRPRPPVAVAPESATSRA